MSMQGVIQISGKPVNNKQLIISFNVLPGSNPDAMGYYISIWEGNYIQSAKFALQTIKITTSNQSGEVLFDQLSIGKESYIVGLGIKRAGGEHQICATLSIPANASSKMFLPAKLSNIMVSADHIGTNFLIAQFATPCHNQPRINNNWIALFHGKFTPDMYQGTNVITVTKAVTNQPTGVIMMKNIPNGLSRFGTYTLVFGMGLDSSGNPDYKMLISSHTFIVWKSSIYLGVAVTAQRAAQHTVSTYSANQFNYTLS